VSAFLSAKFRSHTRGGGAKGVKKPRPASENHLSNTIMSLFDRNDAFPFDLDLDLDLAIGADDGDREAILPPAQLALTPGTSTNPSKSDHDLVLLKFMQRADDRAAEQHAALCSMLEKVGACFAGFDRRLVRLESALETCVPLLRAGRRASVAVAHVVDVARHRSIAAPPSTPALVAPPSSSVTYVSLCTSHSRRRSLTLPVSTCRTIEELESPPHASTTTQPDLICATFDASDENAELDDAARHIESLDGVRLLRFIWQFADAGGAATYGGDLSLQVGDETIISRTLLKELFPELTGTPQSSLTWDGVDHVLFWVAEPEHRRPTQRRRKQQSTSVPAPPIPTTPPKAPLESSYAFSENRELSREHFRLHADGEGCIRHPRIFTVPTRRLLWFQARFGIGTGINLGQPFPRRMADLPRQPRPFNSVRANGPWNWDAPFYVMFTANGEYVPGVPWHICQSAQEAKFRRANNPPMILTCTSNIVDADLASPSVGDKRPRSPEDDVDDLHESSRARHS